MGGPRPSDKPVKSSANAGNSDALHDDRSAPLSDLLCPDVRHVNDYIEKLVFGHLHPRLFPGEPTGSDLQLSARIARLSWLRPEHLDVPAGLLEGVQTQRA